MSVAGDAEHVPTKHPWLLLCTMMLTTVMVALDSTIANVVLPHMQGSLSAAQDQIAWVLTSYIVATAIFIPPTGYLAACLGRQRLLGICVGGFLAASMLCGTATSLPEMVAYRFLQGAFGAGMAPLGQALVMDSFPREKHGQVLSLWGVGAMLGPILGPTLGGYLTEVLNWRWVFYINVPICAVALLGIWKTVPQVKARRDVPFDMFGFALLSLALGAVQLMLDRGHSQNWFSSMEIVIEATVAGLCFYLFLVHMFTARAPFIEPRLFKDRNLVVGLVLIAVVSMVMMAQMALLPSFLQQLMHIPVDTVGMMLMPRGLASMIGMVLTSRLIGRVDQRAMMICGMVGFGLSTYEMSTINLYVDNFTIVRIGLMQGFSMAFVVSPLSIAAFSTLAPDLRTESASMFALMRNIGGSVGVSVLFTRVAQVTQAEHARLGESITPFSDALPPAWQWDTIAGAMSLDGEIVRQAASIAYVHTFLMMAVLALL
ncbi:MAG TPA: DHA2 family efflux MFS transporter permease subunit, partial [Pseudomonadales bacterium]|nr:DHA2 family efflux MFS transporter permease subunit [Pseudomonadales bacterium]